VSGASTVTALLMALALLALVRISTSSLPAAGRKLARDNTTALEQVRKPHHEQAKAGH